MCHSLVVDHEHSQGCAQPPSLSGFVSSFTGSSFLSTQLVSTSHQFFLTSVSWIGPSFQLLAILLLRGCSSSHPSLPDSHHTLLGSLLPSGFPWPTPETAFLQAPAFILSSPSPQHLLLFKARLSIMLLSINNFPSLLLPPSSLDLCPQYKCSTSLIALLLILLHHHHLCTRKQKKTIH